MSEPPAEKKRKVDSTNDNDVSWRAKSIEQFGLQPVPEAWKDSVANGSEDAWQRYYEYRSNDEQKDRDKKNDHSFQNDGSLAFLDEWKAEMKKRIDQSMNGSCKWHWTPDLARLDWDDDARVRSADYYANLYSPFAIPHAIKLDHRFHRRMRLNGIEFGTYWEYRKIDFEDEETVKSKDYTELCKCFEDADIEEEGIETTNLNKSTCQDLRRFLFGTSSEASKKVTCSDIDFWLLIFGSMGSTDSDLSYDLRGSDLGYSWRPDKEMRKKLYDLKASEGNGSECDPNKPFEEYYPKGCSWLKYRVLEITDKLGPVAKHYEPPKPKFRQRSAAENFLLSLAYGGDY